ncbi:MAG TPA: TonB-dependent receptor [Terracidiphilus sp.]|nr:TonB-dependent receptor [Terracidiphilus sp.]
MFASHAKSIHIVPAIAGIVIVLALILAGPRNVRCQVLYGSLSGTVTDPSGAVVPNATVTAEEMSKGTKSEATTDAAGLYRFNELLPGNYKVTVAAQGFTSVETDNVRVNANSARSLDEKVLVAQVQQNITVTAAPPVLQTERADVHTDLTSTELQTLPSISSEGKSFQQLYRIVPGATLPMENNSAAGNPSRAMTSNVNGQSSQGNDTRIDGILDAYPWLPNNVAYVPPSDSIDTVNVATNSFDAEQGMVNGAVVNVQIKTGTNQFHGDLHEFHTDNALKNLNYFNPPGFRRPLNIFNQFGGAVGGPIKRNKVFFFGDWESTRQTQAPSGGNPQTVPAGGLQYSNAKQAGFFDFRGLAVDKSGNPVHIYDPRTGNANGSGRAPISCNGVADTLCLSAADPAALTMASLIPAPNQPGTTSNYLDLQKGFFHRDNYDAKISWVPGQKSTVFGRFSFSNGDIFDPPALGPAGGNATLGGQNGNAYTKIYIVGLGATYAFSPTLFMDANAGYTRQHLKAQDVDITANKAFGLDVLKIPGTNDPTNMLYWGIPAFQFNTYSNLGNPNTGNPFEFRDNQYVGNANLSWLKGPHQFRFGFEGDHTQLNHFQPQGGSFQTARGSFLANGSATEQVTCPSATSNSGCTATDPPTTLQFNSYADFLLGLEDQSGKAIQDSNTIALRWWQWAAYARDQWQATPKLNIDYGLRWEYYPMAYSDHGKGARVLDISTMQVLIGGNGGVPRDNHVKTGAGLFLPRVGIAYHALPNTVLRLGYGLSADSNNWRFLRNAYPADTISSFTGQATGGAVSYSQFAPAASLTGQNAVGPYSSVPVGIVQIPLPDTSSGMIPLPNGVSTTTIPLDFRRGYIHTWNGTVEQQFHNWVLNAGYVGSRAIRPLTNKNANPAPGGGGTAGRILNKEFGGSWSDVNQLIPFGNNYYDALQTKLTRRFHNSSLVGVVYTYSKSIDYEDNEEISFILFPYPAYLPKNRAVAGFDRTHNFETYWSATLPFGKGQRWLQSGVASYIAGGWTLGGVLSALSGTPFTITDSGAGASNLNAPGNTQTVNIVGPIHLPKGLPNQNPSKCTRGDTTCSYFDPAAFARVTTPAVLGIAGRNIVRGPGYFGLDASLFRDFHITERYVFQFEADCFGVTNTPHFGNPTSDYNNSNFGKITGTLAVTNASLGGSGGERQWWFGGKFIF